MPPTRSTSSTPARQGAAPAPGSFAPRVQRLLWCAPILLLAVVLVVRCAWQSDDAYITFRTVWNFWHGYGLRWNIVERVQNYTSPLWMMVSIFCYGLGSEVYWSTTAAAVACAAGAFILTALNARTTSFALFSVVLLASSAAVVDYSACGLENPLLYLLLAAAATIARRPGSTRNVYRFALLTSLIALTRQDAALLVAPALAHLVWSSSARMRALSRALLGLVPLAAWELFALVYYGYPFPNTAYAKLNLDIPTAELIHRGLVYAADSFAHDPLTLATIALAGAFGLARGQGTQRWLALGLALSLAYVTRVGGDFMSGRFYSWTMFLAVPVLEDIPLFSLPRVNVAALAALALAQAARPASLWHSGAAYGRERPPMQHILDNGIADERGYYYPSTGLLPVYANHAAIIASGLPFPPSPGALRGQRLALEGKSPAVTSEAGFPGYFAGPRIHFIDAWALGDPLLAHIPFTPISGWRPGHYPRPIPKGYIESIAAGKNLLADPGLARFYDKVLIITRAPLFSFLRLRTILAMNLGRYDSLLAKADTKD